MGDVVLSVVGVGTLIFLCFALFVVASNPYEFLKLNHETNKSNFVYRYSMLLIPPISLCFGMYNVVFFLLNWMPSDWGSLDDGDFVTVQQSLSATLGSVIGLVLSFAIGRGMVARVQFSASNLRIYFEGRIEGSQTLETLEILLGHLELAKAGDSLFVEDKGIYDAIGRSELPIEALPEIFYDAIGKIQQKLSRI